MKVVFGLQLDHGAWPGHLAGRNAIAGEKWVGINGLTDLLEVLLGLRKKYQTFEERQACLVPKLKALDGFWSKSAQVDPWSSASTLLRWRDQLCLWGWSGDSRDGRLGQLSALCGDLSDGIPDRLVRIDRALRQRTVTAFDLRITDSRSELPTAFKRVVDRLESRGVRVNWSLPRRIASRGDLLTCREKPFLPVGDGSLQLIRPFGVFEAAELAASWLASTGNLESTVIIGASPALDAALRRFALPTTGAGRPADGTSLLSLLPLVLQLGWLPADPAHAFQLLTHCLSVGPVPRKLSRALLKALDLWPSVESGAWGETLSVYLSELAEEATRKESDSSEVARGSGRAAWADDASCEKLRERLEALLLGKVGRESRYPVSEAERRVSVLQGWLQGRRIFELQDERKDPLGPEMIAWNIAIAQCGTIRNLLKLSDAQDFSSTELTTLCQLANESVDRPSAYRAEAGIGSVGSPSCVVGEAKRILWWNCSASSARVDRMPPLSRAELSTLAEAGVRLPDNGVLASQAAAQWQRPFDLCSGEILLVCPKRRENGDDEFPHPIWESIASRVGDRKDLEAIVREIPIYQIEPLRQQAKLEPTPRPLCSFEFDPKQLDLSRKESPSGLEVLVACPFNYVVGRMRHVRESTSGDSLDPDEKRVLGNLGHHVFHHVFLPYKQQVPDIEEAVTRAESFFDTEACKLVATLFLPGADQSRISARRVIVSAVRELARLLSTSGKCVVDVEKVVKGKISELDLEGRLDLQIGSPSVVVDFKWSNAKKHSEALENGDALQLAAYSAILAQEETEYPAVAYFVLDCLRFLTVTAGIEGAELLSGFSPSETWDSVLQTVVDRRKELKAGNLLATGLRVASEKDGGVRITRIPKKESESKKRREIGAALVVPPNCTYCSLQFLCGYAYAEVSS